MKVEAGLRAAGVKPAYESMRLRYTKEAAYVPDFTDAREINTQTIWEAKGRFLSSDRSKMIQVKKAHPHLDIRIVFMRNNKLSKASSTTYMEWAAKHGFQATVYPELPL